MKRLVLILLLPLFLLACDSDEAAGGKLISYSSTNYPITFQVPENWVIMDDADSITIASTESLLSASSVEDGARINIVVSPSFFVGSNTAMELVDTAVRNFREQDGAEIIHETEMTNINTQAAAQTVLRGPDALGNEIIYRYMFIENLSVNQTAVVAAVHDAKHNNLYGQLMADIVNSIQLEDTSDQ